ncbi:MAG TPA: PRC-barrel domain-containing protein [Streptosporangiaceae bacterium]|nr:PRC-barrel domain-containing protein [Streptosporangiaceae bacterium]
MAGMERFTIGARVNCEDGVCGRVSRVVVDPVAKLVTHLAVEPEHRLGLARLVPVDLAKSGPDAVSLACTMAEFEQLDAAEETQFVPGTRGYEVYGPEQVLSWPYYELGDTVIDPDQEGKVSQTVTVDTLPPGEVGVRRGARVDACDGAIGKVQGLVIDPASHRVTHVLLQEGHLLGRKQLAIPISAVEQVGDEVKLNLTRHQVRHLPPVGING